MTDRVAIAPSILSADFTRLAEAVALVEEAGADVIHIDVMDGHFVPNLTIGPPVIRALKRVAKRPLDVHLMIDNADSTIDWYLDAGADMLTVHAEASTHLDRTLRRIREQGASPGVVLNPATPIAAVRDVLGEVDMVLLMSVNPGFGGQAFIGRSVRRCAELAAMCAAEGVAPVIQIDGGIDERTAPLVVAAGARNLVAGNAIFGKKDPAAALRALRAAAEAAL